MESVSPDRSVTFYLPKNKKAGGCEPPGGMRKEACSRARSVKKSSSPLPLTWLPKPITKAGMVALIVGRQCFRKEHSRVLPYYVANGKDIFQPEDNLPREKHSVISGIPFCPLI